jgi:hypothetical protein
LKAFTIPSSVEIIGDRCFQSSALKFITFQEPSRLRTIGKEAFNASWLEYITIPASVEEMDGSAFAKCPLLVMRLAPGNRSFRIRGNLLLTSDGAQIVKLFGCEPDVIVAANVRVLGESCFQSQDRLQRVIFEHDSKLRTIGRSALAECIELMDIAIPDSVERIEEAAFRECCALEACSMDENACLTKIGKEAFAKCRSLKAFDVPKPVDEIGLKCFSRGQRFNRLRFRSSESMKRILGERTLDQALEDFGFSELWRGLKIEVEDGGKEPVPPGWISVRHESTHSTWVRDI